MGKWKHTAGEWHGDEADKGIQTSEDARFYGISAPLTKPFTSKKGKDLVMDFFDRLVDLSARGEFQFVSDFDAQGFQVIDLYASLFPRTCQKLIQSLPSRRT